MTTKTINTNKYGKIDIRKTSKKLNVIVGNHKYERVAWEDTNACYWVKANGYWHRIDNMVIAHQKRFGYRFIRTDSSVYGF